MQKAQDGEPKEGFRVKEGWNQTDTTKSRPKQRKMTVQPRKYATNESLGSLRLLNVTQEGLGWRETTAIDDKTKVNARKNFQGGPATTSSRLLVLERQVEEEL